MTGQEGREAAREAAVARAAAACSSAAAWLASAGVPSEALAEYVPARRKLLVTRKPTMQPLGRVWRIGTLLLAEDGRLFAHGRSTRAAERGRPGYQSLSREERREIAAAALRGGFAEGEPVNFEAVPLGFAPDPGPADDDPALPIGYADGDFRVRWRAGAPLEGAPPLATFFTDRLPLLAP